MMNDIEMTDEEQLHHDVDHHDNAKLFLDLDGFGGPIDLLLELAQKQKVDLMQISVVALADQYLSYIKEVQALELEVAADYLVMAAWLTYLKSKLLIPDDEDEEEQSSEYMAQLLVFQLKRLEAMRNAGQVLFKRSILNQDIYSRGRGQGIRIKRQYEFDLKLHDLLTTYGRLHAQQGSSDYAPPERPRIFKIEEAIQRLGTMLGLAHDWVAMDDLLPLEELKDFIMRKSAVASTFGAFLELAKQGRIDLKQDELFGPIYARKIMDNE